MEGTAIQDTYPDEAAVCYGCGRLNDHGLHLRTLWDGEETVTVYQPRPEQTGWPGGVYGGLLASIVDCASMGTAAAAVYRAEGREMGSAPDLRFATASLTVDYVAPTPMGPPLHVRCRPVEISGRKVLVEAAVWAGDAVTVRGRVLGVRPRYAGE
ncbi:MAG: PaaI family thioesterase [Dermatophilaceae bacterium]